MGAVKLELQKECGLLRDELHGLQMTVLTDSLELVKFGQEVNMRDNLLVVEARV